VDSGDRECSLWRGKDPNQREKPKRREQYSALRGRKREETKLKCLYGVPK